MVNRVILVGSVGKDPEVKHLESGAIVANFSLATNESYKNKSGERVTNTEWHSIVAWRHTAELAEKYIKKGSKLYIEGRIKTRSYESKGGEKRYITEIYADNIQLLDSKPKSETASPQHTTPQPPDNQDLPF